MHDGAEGNIKRQRVDQPQRMPSQYAGTKPYIRLFYGEKFSQMIISTKFSIFFHKNLQDTSIPLQITNINYCG